MKSYGPVTNLKGKVYDWLHTNPITESGINTPDFVYNMEWDDYLQGIKPRDQGDHTCLLAIANIYNIIEVIASSNDLDLRCITANDFSTVNNTVGSNRQTIFLGHEFEHHFIRLEEIIENEAPLIDQPNDSSTMHVVIKVIEGVMYPWLNLTSHKGVRSKPNCWW